MRTIKRHISTPLDTLMRIVGLTPGQLDKALDLRVLDPAPALLRNDHPLIQTLGESSGFNVVWIGRRHRYLLLTVEQRACEKTEDELIWTYHEYTRNYCEFSCPGLIGQDFKLALIGQPLGKLGTAPAIVSSLIIESFADDRDGWTAVRVDPKWLSF